ncbi:hypothetical protein GOODEAATRI_011454 [Goodea atripinnis]|uniref:Secreted protein n=1 Tax=Goodea atripinnis TaxID=208336 RepID=A0ABV0PMZ2_9TELE
MNHDQSRKSDPLLERFALWLALPLQFRVPKPCRAEPCRAVKTQSISRSCAVSFSILMLMASFRATIASFLRCMRETPSHGHFHGHTSRGASRGGKINAKFFFFFFFFF